MTEAILMADKMIDTIMNDAWCDDYILMWSSHKNFRKDVLPTYKGNRKDIERPILLEALRSHLKETHESKELYGMEGDDLLGMFMDTDTVLCTIDKDLDQITGVHYNWNKEETYEVSERQGAHMFYMQILTGDSTDGYKGCPSIGKKRAQEALKGWEDEYDAWSRIVTLYELKGLTEADAIQQARVAYMNRDKKCWRQSVDGKRTRVYLWLPFGETEVLEMDSDGEAEG